MELSDHDIDLIESYLSNTLSGQELSAFEARMAADPDLAEEVDLIRDVEKATSRSGRQSLKRELAGVEASVIAAGALEPYTPEMGGGGGGGGSAAGKFFWRLLRSLITTAIIGGGAYVVYNYQQTGKWFWEQQSTTTTTERIITRDTTYRNDTVIRQQKVPGPAGGTPESEAPGESTPRD